MKRNEMSVPFFSVSPKSYLYGEELIELAKITDELAKNINSTIFFTAPPTELYRVAKETENLVITAQHTDSIDPGRGMGKTLMESLAEIGVGATFLNHAERPLTINAICKAIAKAKEIGIITIICVDSKAEAKAIATLDPDIILCEPSKLIST